MQAYMDMLNPDIGADTANRNEIRADGVPNPPPPPTYPPPPPPQAPPDLPPAPSYPAPPPPQEPQSAEFLKVKSNLRHVDSKSSKKEVRTVLARACFQFFSKVSGHQKQTCPRNYIFILFI